MDLYKNTEWKEVVINGESKNVPFDWDIPFIKSLTKVTSGGTPSTKEKSYWNKKEIKWLSSGEVCNKKIYNTEKYISKEGLKNSSAKLIPTKSVLIALAGQGKTRGQVGITEVELSTNQSVGAILPDNSFNSDYLFLNLLNRYKELRILSGGDNGRGGLNLEMIKNLDVMLPSKQEQTAIVSLLLSQDSIIEKIKKLISILEKRNEFMTEKLVSGHIRIKEEDKKTIFYENSANNWKTVTINGERTAIPCDWEKETISKIFNVSRGKVISKEFIDKNKGIYPVYSSATENNGCIGYINSHMYDGEYLTWTTDGIYAGTLFSRTGKFNCTNVCGVLKLNVKDNIKGFYYLLQHELPKHVTKLANSKLMSNTVEKIEFISANNVERILIKNVLDNLNSEVETYKKILEKEEKTFTFLLEELMSGRLRIKI